MLSSRVHCVAVVSPVAKGKAGQEDGERGAMSCFGRYEQDEPPWRGGVGTGTQVKRYFVSKLWGHLGKDILNKGSEVGGCLACSSKEVGMAVTP